MITPALDDPRRLNQQRIDALRDQLIIRREDTTSDLPHDREQAAEADYRYDDDEQLNEGTDFHSGLGY